jgi:predicted membrane chloride channel (bestrophin family)
VVQEDLEVQAKNDRNMITFILGILIAQMVVIIAVMLIRAWEDPDLRKLIKVVFILVGIAVLLFVIGSFL